MLCSLNVVVGDSLASPSTTCMNIILLQFDVSKKIMNSKQECGDETL
jgi:hypothetical protein